MNSSYILWIPLGLAIIWFMIIRPQRTARARAQSLESSLEVGQEVVTIGGLYGYIVSIDDRSVELDVADGVTLRFARRAIAGKAPADDPDDEDAGEDDGLEDDGELGIDGEPADNFEPGASSQKEPVIETAPNADDSSGR